eukprot:1161694-Pelagomonas_calceolata.AAC.12
MGTQNRPLKATYIDNCVVSSQWSSSAPSQANPLHIGGPDKHKHERALVERQKRKASGGVSRRHTTHPLS